MLPHKAPPLTKGALDMLRTNFRRTRAGLRLSARQTIPSVCDSVYAAQPAPLTLPHKNTKYFCGDPEGRPRADNLNTINTTRTCLVHTTSHSFCSYYIHIASPARVKQTHEISNNCTIKFFGQMCDNSTSVYENAQLCRQNAPKICHFAP